MVRKNNLSIFAAESFTMFKFKHFTIEQDQCAMKVGTDGVLLGAWANGGTKVLDVGAGTGIISLMIAQRYPQALITALDIDEGAVLQSRQNVAHAGVGDRVKILFQSVQDHQGHYDAIVSNPPFFIDSLAAPDAQRNMARHTATLSYTALMKAVSRMLTDHGELSVIVPFDYRQRMEDEACFVGFFLSRKCAVKTVEGKPPRRYMLAFKRYPCQCVYETMTIGDEYYQQLTRDFYL